MKLKLLTILFGAFIAVGLTTVVLAQAHENEHGDNHCSREHYCPTPTPTPTIEPSVTPTDTPTPTVNPCDELTVDVVSEDSEAYKLCITPTETPTETPTPTVEPTAPPSPHGDGLSDGKSDGKSDGRSSSPQATLSPCTASTCGWK